MSAHIHTEDEWPAAADENFVSFSLREKKNMIAFPGVSFPYIYSFCVLCIKIYV